MQGDTVVNKTGKAWVLTKLTFQKEETIRKHQRLRKLKSRRSFATGVNKVLSLHPISQ